MGVYLKTGKMGALVLVAVSGLLGGGCAAPPAAAALAGTWILTTDDPSALVEAVLVFDDFGQLTNIRFIVPGQIIDTAPTILTSSVTVVGNQVTIVQTFDNNSSFNFVGTLDSTNTVATGNLTLVLFQLTLNGVAATMQQQ